MLVQKPFNWEKKGLLFKPTGQFGWMNSHAQVPTVLHIEKEGIVRIYFSTRPHKTLSLTTYVDFDENNFSKQIHLNPKPILELGDPGAFDEHGIMPSSIIEYKGTLFFYYSGWSRGKSLPYSNLTGLAFSDDFGKTFKKFSNEPILHKTATEPYSATSPHVFLHNNTWFMIYCSGTQWIKINNKLEHTYDLKIAYSDDGINWEQSGKIVIPQSDKKEAITKPTLLYLDNIFHLLFCYRSSDDFRGGKGSYRLGYASSKDLVTWDRKDYISGLSVSSIGWDSEMIAYPSISLIKNMYLLFYNGNHFGKEGFGTAELSY